MQEGEPTTKELDKNNGDITKCISPELIKYMKDADITLVNNEFCYSDRGAPLANKCGHSELVQREQRCLMHLE